MRVQGGGVGVTIIRQSIIHLEVAFHRLVIPGNKVKWHNEMRFEWVINARSFYF